MSDNVAAMSSHKLIRVHLKCVSICALTYSVCLGKQGSIRNSGELDITEFEMADSK